MHYTAKYQPGAITNSMMEAAEFCGYKFWALYLNRAQLESRYEKILDSMSLGVLVHAVIERFPLTNGGFCPITAVLDAISDWQLDLDQISIFPRYQEAVRLTLQDGLNKGRTYTTPTWTNYWKVHCTELDADITQLNSRLIRDTWLCDIQPVDFVLRAITALQNYKDLLPELNAGLIFESAEQTFHFKYMGETLAGTIDRLDMEAETGGFWITDWKTGVKKYTSEIVHNLNQMNLYALDLMSEGKQVSRYRIVSLERKEIISVPFLYGPYRKYVDDRLPRLIHNVNVLQNTPPKLLPVASGRSFNPGCPCSLAELPDADPLKCNSIYLGGV